VTQDPGTADGRVPARRSHQHAASLASTFDAVAGLEAADVADLVGFITSRPRQVHLRQAIVVPTLLPA